MKKSTKTKVLTVPILPIQETVEEIGMKVTLQNQLIQDLTGLDVWDVGKAPSAVWELAEHLLHRGWTKPV